MIKATDPAPQAPRVPQPWEHCLSISPHAVPSSCGPPGPSSWSSPSSWLPPTGTPSFPVHFLGHLANTVLHREALTPVCDYGCRRTSGRFLTSWLTWVSSPVPSVGALSAQMVSVSLHCCPSCASRGLSSRGCSLSFISKLLVALPECLHPCPSGPCSHPPLLKSCAHSVSSWNLGSWALGSGSSSMWALLPHQVSGDFSHSL